MEANSEVNTKEDTTEQDLAQALLNDLESAVRQTISPDVVTPEKLPGGSEEAPSDEDDITEVEAASGETEPFASFTVHFYSDHIEVDFENWEKITAYLIASSQHSVGAAHRKLISQLLRRDRKDQDEQRKKQENVQWPEKTNSRANRVMAPAPHLQRISKPSSMTQ